MPAAAPDFRLRGAAVPGCDSPQARRAWLRSCDAAQLGEWLLSNLAGYREMAHKHGASLAAFLGAPHGEVVASPFGFRACAMGAAAGAAVVHHELRPAWRWDPRLLPDDGAADPDHGQWLQGALHVGRFEGFCQDLPLATFNPNHSARWTSHELLHRVCGFAWRPGLSRWFLYHAARLGEIVPVAHWYGTDLVLRLDEDGFDRARDVQSPSADVAKARWLVADDSELRPRIGAAVAALREAARWVDAELAAIASERQTGQTVSVADPLLDSVSDAIAYTAGHHRRLADPAVARALQAGAVAGVHRFEHLCDYTAHVEDVFDRLVFGDIEVVGALADARRAGRLLWDLVQRAMHCDPLTGEEVLGERLEAICTVTAKASSGDGGAALAMVPEVADMLQDAALQEVMPIGLAEQIDPLPRSERVQLAAGIAAVAPGLVQCQVEAEGSAQRFVDTMQDQHLFARAPLVQRLVDATAQDWPALHVEALLARAICGATERDDQTERLAMATERWPQDLAGCSVRRNPAFKPVPAPASVLVGRYFEAVSVLPWLSFIEALWSLLASGSASAARCLQTLDEGLDDVELAEGWPTTARQWLVELANAGAIGLVGPQQD